MPQYVQLHGNSFDDFLCKHSFEALTINGIKPYQLEKVFKGDFSLNIGEREWYQVDRSLFALDLDNF